jgi:hypothetical protein
VHRVWQRLGLFEKLLEASSTDVEAGVSEVKRRCYSALATHRVPRGHVVDSERTLEHQLRRSGATGILVRPGRFIYGSDREPTPTDHARVVRVVNRPTPSPFTPVPVGTDQNRTTTL